MDAPKILTLVLTEDEADLLQYYLDYPIIECTAGPLRAMGRDPAGNISVATIQRYIELQKGF